MCLSFQVYLAVQQKSMHGIGRGTGVGSEDGSGGGEQAFTNTVFHGSFFSLVFFCFPFFMFFCFAVFNDVGLPIQ